jgi:hypothetical protein
MKSAVPCLVHLRVAQATESHAPSRILVEEQKRFAVSMDVLHSPSLYQAKTASVTASAQENREPRKMIRIQIQVTTAQELEDAVNLASTAADLIAAQTAAKIRISRS